MDVEAFSLPLSEPLRTASGDVETRAGYLVRVESDGETGVGEATPLPGWTESLEECERALEAATPERPPDPEATPAAAHAVSLAALDRAARAVGESLASALGGAAADSVPVNATVGDAPADATVAAARTAVDRGFRTLKLKVGARPVEEDVARVRAVREAVGASVSIRLDANGAWTLAEATAAADALEPLGVEYVEQPLPADRLEAHGGVDAVPVALDESLVTCGPERVLDAGVADALVLKPMALGGVERARSIASRALERGVDPVVTTTVDAVVARTAAVHLAATVPDVAACGLATGDLLAADLAPDPAPIRAGRATVPSGPGTGVDLSRSPDTSRGPDTDVDLEGGD